MKATYYLMSALLTGGLLASCSDTNDEVGSRSVDETGELASVSVQLVGNSGGSRAAAVSSVEENAIKNFTVYVFNSSDVLENSALETNELRTTIEDLTTGDKTIVVFANLDTYPTVSNNVTTYSSLTAEINLDDQNGENIISKGFVMGGMKTQTLVKGNNPVSMSIERAIAKIVIGSISIDQDLSAYPETFEITDVHIMKAMPLADITPVDVTGKKGVSDLLYDGLTDSAYASEQRAYLTDNFSDPIVNSDMNNDSGVVFYVFPNIVESDATLLTFEGTYGGSPVYYPFRINEVVQTSGDGTGEFIKRNTVHTINVIFKNPGTGKDNPVEPLDPADMTITVSPADWTVIPTHNLEW